MAVTRFSLLDSRALTHRLKDMMRLASLPARLALILSAPMEQVSLQCTLGHWSPTATPSQFLSPVALRKGGRSRGKGAGKGQGVSGSRVLCGHGTSTPPSAPPLFPHPNRAVSRRHATQILAATKLCTDPPPSPQSVQQTMCPPEGKAPKPSHMCIRIHTARVCWTVRAESNRSSVTGTTRKNKMNCSIAIVHRPSGASRVQGAVMGCKGWHAVCKDAEWMWDEGCSMWDAE